MCFKHLVYSLTVRVDVEQIFHDLSILPPCRLLELIWNELKFLIKWYYFVFSHTLQSNKSYKCIMCFVLCCLEIILKGICFIIFLFEKEVFLIVLPPPPCNLETDILFDFLNFIDQRQGHFHIDDVNNIISNKADRLTKFTMKRKVLFKLLVKSWGFLSVHI